MFWSLVGLGAAGEIRHTEMFLIYSHNKVEFKTKPARRNATLFFIYCFFVWESYNGKVWAAILHSNRKSKNTIR